MCSDGRHGAAEVVWLLVQQVLGTAAWPCTGFLRQGQAAESSRGHMLPSFGLKTSPMLGKHPPQFRHAPSRVPRTVSRAGCSVLVAPSGSTLWSVRPTGAERGRLNGRTKRSCCKASDHDQTSLNEVASTVFCAGHADWCRQALAKPRYCRPQQWCALPIRPIRKRGNIHTPSGASLDSSCPSPTLSPNRASSLGGDKGAAADT
jgi:hypothetical protein